MPPKKSRRESQKVRMKKAATPDDLLNTEIKIVDEGESGIEMTAEERRRKKEEEKAKVEEKKKVEEAVLLVEEKKKLEVLLVEEKKTNAAAKISEESKKSETAVEAVIPPSPVQQMTLPYMKRAAAEGEMENTGIEAFSYFSSTTSSNSTAIMESTTTNAVDTTFEESTNPTTSAAMLAYTTTTTIVMDSTTNTAKDATFEESPDNLQSSSATFDEQSAASVVLEARAIVAAVIGEASYISSFDSSRSKSVEGDDDPLGEERNFSAVNREVSESDSEAKDEESDGLGLLEEIKEEITREEKADVESNPGAKKGSYQRPGTWTNITINSNFVQNTEEPLSPAEDKEFDVDEKLENKMGNWKAPKAVAQGGGEVRVKEVAMADSPLVDGSSGRLVKEAGDMHLYSSIFSVMGQEDKEVKKGALKEKEEKRKETKDRNGEIVALLPHFLSFTSLTNTEVDSMRALVLQLPSGQLSLLKPLQLEENNFAICLPGPALVALVSPLPALLIRAVLVPFSAQTPLLAPLAVALLPDSPATLLNLPNHLQGWKKVGYEQQCCIRRGESLVVKHQGQDGHGGDGGHDGGHSGHGGHGKQGGDGGDSLHISLLTPPQNSSWVNWVGSVNGDFLDASITVERTGSIVHTGPLPLYSGLKVEREASHYLPPAQPQPVHPETLADRPRYGKTTNLEPFFAALRNGVLAEKSVEHLSSQLGAADGEGVVEALARWKEQEGGEATLAAFLHILQKPEVSLLAVEKEIRQNEENSRCGIPALAIH